MSASSLYPGGVNGDTEPELGTADIVFLAPIGVCQSCWDARDVEETSTPLQKTSQAYETEKRSSESAMKIHEMDEFKLTKLP